MKKTVWVSSAILVLSFLILLYSSFGSVLLNCNCFENNYSNIKYKKIANKAASFQTLCCCKEKNSEIINSEVKGCFSEKSCDKDNNIIKEYYITGNNQEIYKTEVIISDLEYNPIKIFSPLDGKKFIQTETNYLLSLNSRLNC